MTNFILEHVYNPECEMLLFLVRTLNPDVKLTYKIHLLNREEDSNRITFKAKTVDFNEFGFLEKYPELDSRKCFAIHNRTIQDYSFVNPDDNMTYFSFHIEFCGAGVEGLDY